MPLLTELGNLYPVGSTKMAHLRCYTRLWSILGAVELRKRDDGFSQCFWPSMFSLRGNVRYEEIFGTTWKSSLPCAAVFWAFCNPCRVAARLKHPVRRSATNERMGRRSNAALPSSTSYIPSHFVASGVGRI